MPDAQPSQPSPVPEHLSTVTPRLVVPDGAAAITFYAEAFGAEEVGERFNGPEGELIHAEVRIGDSVVMITEEGGMERRRARRSLSTGPSARSWPPTGRTWMLHGRGRSRLEQRCSSHWRTSSTATAPVACAIPSASSG